jgi:hypothetical protein
MGTACGRPAYEFVASLSSIRMQSTDLATNHE